MFEQAEPTGWEATSNNHFVCKYFGLSSSSLFYCLYEVMFYFMDYFENETIYATSLIINNEQKYIRSLFSDPHQSITIASLLRRLLLHNETPNKSLDSCQMFHRNINLLIKYFLSLTNRSLSFVLFLLVLPVYFSSFPFFFYFFYCFL